MNRFEIIWRDYGIYSSTARNSVSEDPRPTEVVADEWRFCTRTNNDNSIECMGIIFNDNNDNDILTLFEFPLGIRKITNA